MIKNYLKIALRNLRNHKGYTSINVAGLAIGLTCCLLIALFVRYELSYDRFFDHTEDIYRIAWHSEMPQTRTPHPMANAMVEDFPEVVAATSLTPLWGPGLTRPAYTIRYQDRQFDEAGVLGVDSTFSEVFSFPVVAGDARAALREPGRILLTASMARKYFGDEDPLGKPLLFNGEIELTVGAVLADVPEATHFHFDFLVSYVSLKAANPGDPFFTWEDFGHYNYIRLAEGTNPAALRHQLPAWSQRYIDFSAETQAAMAAGTRGFRLQQLTDIHLHSQIRWELEPNGNIAYVYIFSVAAVLLLLIACINFMNLATARSAKRAREVGMRKTLGAARPQLIAQFLGESLLLSTSAVLLAVALTELLMPFFNNLAGTSLSLWQLDGLSLIAGLAGIALF
ncbi:MAG TPA: ABC transporter permease, partial [Rhodothermales bacterium]|nr:ABC transporter permease [Rhodothermales bacterium]